MTTIIKISVEVQNKLVYTFNETLRPKNGMRTRPWLDSTFYQTMYKWIKGEFGGEYAGYHDTPGNIGTGTYHYAFEDERDAMIFVLRWL